MLLPLGMTELVIHHMANADTVAGVTRALLLASGYADADFQVLAEMLGGARLPLHLQATHGNSTVVRAIVRMEDPTHGLCPLVHDIHRGDHTGPITVTATFSGNRDIPMQCGNRDIPMQCRNLHCPKYSCTLGKLQMPCALTLTRWLPT